MTAEGAAMDPVPRWQLGYLSPLSAVDVLHYEFYRSVPSDAMLATYPLVVGEFTKPSAEAALARAGKGIAYLERRGAQRIAFGGMPVSAFAGRAGMLDLLLGMSRATGIEVSSDVEDVVSRLQAVGASAIALAAKWDEAVLDAASRYFEDAGFEVLGSVGAGLSAGVIADLPPGSSVDQAVELGRAAFRRFPAADALVLGGGTWFSVPASEALEAEFGKPVVSNSTALFYETCRKFGLSTEAMDHLLMARVSSDSAGTAGKRGAVAGGERK